MDKGAGIDLLKKVGDAVSEGEPIYRIYACVAADFRFAREVADEDSGFVIMPGETPGAGSFGR